MKAPFSPSVRRLRASLLLEEQFHVLRLKLLALRELFHQPDPLSPEPLPLHRNLHLARHGLLRARGRDVEVAAGVACRRDGAGAVHLPRGDTGRVAARGAQTNNGAITDCEAHV